jgi:hypothetical protein
MQPRKFFPSALDLPASGTCTFLGRDRIRRTQHGAIVDDWPTCSGHWRIGKNHSLLRASRRVASAFSECRWLPAVCPRRCPSTSIRSPGTRYRTLPGPCQNAGSGAGRRSVSDHAPPTAYPGDGTVAHRAAADCRVPTPRTATGAGSAPARKCRACASHRWVSVPGSRRPGGSTAPPGRFTSAVERKHHEHLNIGIYLEAGPTCPLATLYGTAHIDDSAWAAWRPEFEAAGFEMGERLRQRERRAGPEITMVALDIRLYSAIQRQALLAHRTQSPPDSLGARLPDNLYRRAFATAYFICLHPPRHQENANRIYLIGWT